MTTLHTFVTAGELIVFTKSDNTKQFITWNIQDDNIYFWFYVPGVELNPDNFKPVSLPLACKSYVDQAGQLSILIIPLSACPQDFKISYCYDNKVNALVFYLVSDIESIKNTTSHPAHDNSIVFDTMFDLNSQQEKIVLFEII